MAMKLHDPVEITPVFLEGESYLAQDNLEQGKVYISEHWETVIHLCLCGCGQKCVIHLNKPGTPENKKTGWDLIKNGDKVSFHPSFGNWSHQSPYHAHYVITNNIAVFHP